MCENCIKAYDAYIAHAKLRAEINETEYKEPDIKDWQSYREEDWRVKAQCTELYPDLTEVTMRLRSVRFFYQDHEVMFVGTLFGNLVTDANAQIRKAHRRNKFHKNPDIFVEIKTLDGAKIFPYKDNEKVLVKAGHVHIKEIVLETIYDERDRDAALLVKNMGFARVDNWQAYCLFLYRFASGWHAAAVRDVMKLEWSPRGTWNSYDPELLE